MWLEVKRTAYDFPVSECDFFVNRYFETRYHLETTSFCHVQIQPGFDWCYLHHYVVKMSGRIMVQLKKDVADFKKFLRYLGLRRIIGIRPVTDDLKTWFHFLGLFGEFTSRASKLNGIDCMIVEVEV